MTLQAHYRITYTVTGLLFLCFVLGSLVGGASNPVLDRRLGFGRAMVLGASVQLTGLYARRGLISLTCRSAIQATAPPFAIYAIAWSLTGFGSSLLDTHATAWAAGQPDSATLISILNATCSSCFPPLR